MATMSHQQPARVQVQMPRLLSDASRQRMGMSRYNPLLSCTQRLSVIGTDELKMGMICMEQLSA